MYNTGNHVSSAALKDMADNAQVFDALVTKTEGTITDRLGNVRRPFQKIVTDMGFQPLSGSFQTGATITAINQTLYDEVSHVFYSWGGALPKVVSSGSTPATAGGVGTGAWVDRTDLTLRGKLSSEGGVDLVNGALKLENLALKPIYDLPSYNNADIYQAWLDSVSRYGYVYLSGGNSTQYTLVGTRTDLYNTTVIADRGVTLIVSDDQYPLLGSIKLSGDLKVKTASINTISTSSKIDKISPVARLKNNLLKPSLISFDDCYAASVSGDTYTSNTKGSQSNSSVLVPLSAGAMSGLFVPVFAGESVSAHLKVETGAATAVGVLLRCSNGWIKITGNVGSTTYNISHKPYGSAEFSEGTFTPVDTNLISYAAGNAAIGIAVANNSEYYFLVNGTSKSKLFSAVGDILDVGFIFDGVSISSTGRITGLCCYTAEKSIYGFGPLNIAIYGDSTADEYLGSFDKYLYQLLDGENASRVISINNYAIAGKSFQEQFDLLKTNGPGEAYIICMVAGTNDIQGGMSADTFAAKVTAFIDYCAAHGRVPMLVEPWMWYPNTMISAGQPSRHYADGSELRESGKRVAVSRGAIYVSTTHELPAPLPQYFNSEIDPLLRDDIHQSQLGYRLYAELVASHIIDYMGKITRTGVAVPPAWKTSLVTTISDSLASDRGLKGAFAVTRFTNGSAILSLPRWCRPKKTISVPAVFTVSGGALSACYVTITTLGSVIVNGLTTGESVIIIDTNW